ncbi:hypothetical protein AB0C81_28820 [Streptomyces roseoverticillatus]|uniref:hypothetical protein n=1 Tax=Streptomyces roseoverticillatus TaxID=66429 RepID=UPI0033F494D4
MIGTQSRLGLEVLRQQHTRPGARSRATAEMDGSTASAMNTGHGGKRGEGLAQRVAEDGLPDGVAAQAQGGELGGVQHRGITQAVQEGPLARAARAAGALRGLAGRHGADGELTAEDLEDAVATVLILTSLHEIGQQVCLQPPLARTHISRLRSGEMVEQHLKFTLRSEV